ncbi:unnamed protein product, partial [Ilex paraguariensis]
GWLGYAFALMLIFLAVFVVLTRCFSQGRPVDELKVAVPPAMNTMEQLLAVQNAISQAEELIQDGNIVLLKLRALLLSIFPQVLFTSVLSGLQIFSLWWAGDGQQRTLYFNNWQKFELKLNINLDMVHHITE